MNLVSKLKGASTNLTPGDIAILDSAFGGMTDSSLHRLIGMSFADYANMTGQKRGSFCCGSALQTNVFAAAMSSARPSPAVGLGKVAHTLAFLLYACAVNDSTGEIRDHISKKAAWHGGIGNYARQFAAAESSFTTIVINISLI